MTGYGRVKQENLGQCYELCARRVAFGPDERMLLGYEGAYLCHGTIEGMGNPPLDHAWVVEPDDTIWEPSTATSYQPKEFQHLFHPHLHLIYTVTVTRQLMFEHQHFGPWSKS